MRAKVGRPRAAWADDEAAFAQLKYPMSRPVRHSATAIWCLGINGAAGGDVGWRPGSPSHCLTRQVPTFMDLSRPLTRTSSPEAGFRPRAEGPGPCCISTWTVRLRCRAPTWSALPLTWSR